MPSGSASVHSVHIYGKDSDLISRLCGISASGLNVGDAVLIVATGEHRKALVRELEAAGVDVRERARIGLFKMLDAEETLSTFMVSDRPNRRLFDSSVGTILQETRRASRSKGRGLTVFGEMVAVLWDEGNKRGALELESMWNDALKERAFHLHCAYPRSGFVNGDVDAVSQLHSHVVQ